MMRLELIKKLSPDSLSVMELKNELDVQIAEKIIKFPFLGEKIKDKWNFSFTREFDMTNDSHLFKTSNDESSLPLYEGKMIHQFTHLFSEPRYWVDEKEARKVLIGRDDDKGQTLDYQNYRVAFRAVGENTNSRNFISTIVPKNVFCGNSLIVSKNSTDYQTILFVTALFNSLTVDYQIKKKIARNMNMFYVSSLPIPRLMESEEEFAPIVERAAKLICTTLEFDDLAKEVGLGSWKNGATDEIERQRLRAELDALVAHLYGLTEEEFTYILTTFPLVSDVVKVARQNAFRDAESGLIK